MCWNANVSLNTFLFSGFVLLLIMYNNAFTQYKIQIMNNKWIYLFFASFIIIQLIEFFIWRNLDNKYNNVFSIIASLVILSQPVVSLMIITNLPLRNLLLSIYLSISIPYSIYTFSTNHIHSTVSKSGHLTWDFLNDYLEVSVHSTPVRNLLRFVSSSDSSTRNQEARLKLPILQTIWICFFLFSFLYEKIWVGIVFGLITLIIACVNYLNDNSVPSMWCWSVNSFMILFAFYLLILMPFFEKMQLC